MDRGTNTPVINGAVRQKLLVRATKKPEAVESHNYLLPERIRQIVSVCPFSICECVCMYVCACVHVCL